MYQEVDSGNGVTKRRIKSLNTRIEGNRTVQKLFKYIREECIQDIDSLLQSTKGKLQEVLDQCSADIEHDLELVRSDEALSSGEGNLAELMSDVLNGATQAREEVFREFEALFPRRDAENGVSSA